MLEVHMHTGSFLRTLPHRLLTQGPLITILGVFLMAGGILAGLNPPDHPDFPKYTGFIILGVGAVMTVIGLALCSVGVGLSKTSKSEWSDDESEVAGSVTTILKLPPVIETPPGVVPRTFLCPPASKSMGSSIPSVHTPPNAMFLKDGTKKPSWDDPPPPYSSTYKTSISSTNSSVIHQFT